MHPSAQVSTQQVLTSSRVQGWQWLDEDWHIDMTGHEDACVDNEGWYYAVDFNWLKHPPAPASGRFKRVCQLNPPKSPCSPPLMHICSASLPYWAAALLKQAWLTKVFNPCLLLKAVLCVCRCGTMSGGGDGYERGCAMTMRRLRAALYASCPPCPLCHRHCSLSQSYLETALM